MIMTLPQCISDNVTDINERNIKRGEEEMMEKSFENIHDFNDIITEKDYISFADSGENVETQQIHSETNIERREEEKTENNCGSIYPFKNTTTKRVARFSALKPLTKDKRLKQKIQQHCCYNI